MLRLPSLAALAVVASACSSTTTSTPSGGTCALAKDTAGYPTTGCSTRGDVGDTIDNFVFEGRESGISSPRKTIRLGDYFDATGAKNKFLVISVSAFWCVACGTEADQLPGLNAKYGSKGVKFLTDVAEDAAGNPTTADQVDTWINGHKLDTIVANDKDFVLQTFFTKSSMPLNMIVDLRTMKIVVKFTGASLDKITAELDKRL